MITTVGFRRMQIHCHSTYNNNNIEISSDEETTNEKVMHKSNFRDFINTAINLRLIVN